MKKTLVLKLLFALFMLMACDPTGASSDETESHKSAGTGLEYVKLSRIQYTTKGSEPEYKSAEWEGNVLYEYDSDGTTVITTKTYDTKGRELKVESATETRVYRYEGDGDSNIASSYDRQYLTLGDEAEYKSAEWLGSVWYIYDSNGDVKFETAYDEKGRFVSFTTSKYAVEYRYEGEGSENIFSKYDRQYLLLGWADEYKFLEWEDNILYSYDRSGKVINTLTYDERGRILKSESARGTETHRYVD